MSVLDIFWIFILLTSLQPVMTKRFLDAMRQRKIAEIERERNSRVILMVHRQETMSLLGFPLMRYIDMQDAEQVLRAIQMTDDDMPLDFVLHTPGGLVLAATQIARAVKGHKGKVTVFVPHMAMSGGTLIAMAADEIVMCDHSALGPVDPQLGDQPAASLVKVVHDKPIKDTDDKTLVMADIGQKAIAQVRATTEKLLQGMLDEKKAKALAATMSEGRWTHDHAIFPDEAAALGFKVNTEMPQSVLELMALYPQPVRRQQGVEFLPRPHHDGGGGKGG